MKTYFNRLEPKVFTPVELLIRVETREELLALRGLYGVSGEVAATVMRHSAYKAEVSLHELADLYEKAFVQLHEEAVSQGLTD